MLCRLFIWLLLLLQARVAIAQLDTSIRRVDWVKQMTNDKKHFSICSDCEGHSIKPVFDIKGTDHGGALGEVSYADFNHDDKEDAVVELWMDGSGRFAAFVLFLQSQKGPVFTMCDGGPRFEVNISRDTIYADHALYGADPTCCPSEHKITPIIVRGKKVHRLKPTIYPSGDAIYAVQRFYSRLSGDEFEAAYENLSTQFRRAHPYKQWIKGYQHTNSIDVRLDSVMKNDRIAIWIKSVDEVKGKKDTRLFEGSWKVTLDRSNPYHLRWVLSDPAIKEIKH